MADLYILYADLRREIGRHLGYGRDTSGWSSDETTDVADILDSGLRRVYFPVDPRTRKSHTWSWLLKVEEFSTEAPYEGDVDGALASVTTAGVCTLDDAGSNTWPTWAASGELLIDGVTYLIDTRDSGSQLTFKDTALPAAITSQTFKLGQHRYNLPDDFLALDSPVTYRSGEANYYPALQYRNEQDIRVWRQAYEYFTYPLACSVVPRSFDATAGQRFDIVLGPTPDRVLRFVYRYVRLPDTIDATNLYHAGGPAVSELCLSACLAEADAKLNDGGTGYYERRFMMELEAAIQVDRSMHTPQIHGYIGDPDESFRMIPLDAIYRDFTRTADTPSL